MTTQAYLQAANKKGLCPLNVRYFHNMVFFPIPLGVSLKPEDFDKKKQVVKDSHPDHKTLNYQITLIKNRMLELAQEMLLKELEPSRELVKAAYLISIQNNPFPFVTNQTVEVLPVVKILEPEPKQKTKKKLKKTTDYVTEITDYTGLSPEFVSAYYRFSELASEWIDTSTNTVYRTKKQRRCWLKITTEFALNTKTSLDFSNFDHNFYYSYAQYLMFTSDHNLFNNAFGTLVKRLKTFLNWLEDSKNIIPCKHYKKFKVLTEEKQIENAYLNRAELELLWNFETQNEARRDHYRKVTDLTYLQCSVGLRWSDLTNKDGLKVELMNGKKVLKGKTSKSNFKQTYLIPLELDSRIELLLIRYNYNFHKIMSDVEYNRRVKEVLKEFYDYYKMHQKTYRIYRYKLNQQYSFDLYKYQMIASHSNRRAFVSWLYKDLRLPEKFILKIIGSKSNQELKKYIGVDSSDILEAVTSLNMTSHLKVA